MRPRQTLTSLLLRPGSALPAALAALALSGVAIVSLGSNWSKSAAITARAPARSLLRAELTPMRLEVALRRAGITPETLAAAGLSPQEVGTIVSAGRAYLDDHIVALEAADEAYGSACFDRDRLQRLIESGLATEQDVAALGAAQAAVASAMSTRDGFLAELSAEATGGLDAGPRAVLAQLGANSAWDLPTQYLAVERTQAQWIGLRDDLANLRIAPQIEEDPDPACVQAVTAANADPAVSAAAGFLSNNLGPVTQAWTEAIGG